LKKYIVGAFTRETWSAHGKRWLESAVEHKGNAQILLLCTFSMEQQGSVKVVEYDGNVLAHLAKMDGIFLYAAPNTRFQAEPVALFEAATEKFAVVERSGIAQSQPFGGKLPVYEDFWAAPSDLIDMLYRVVEMSFGTGLKPPFFDFNFVSYFTEFFPWFRSVMEPVEYMPIYDAHSTNDYYADPRSLKRLTAVGLDKPESKKVGVLGSIVKTAKPLLTTKSEKKNMIDPPSTANKDRA
jgi:hypothetical protein